MQFFSLVSFELSLVKYVSADNTARQLQGFVLHISYFVFDEAPPLAIVPDCFQLCLLGDLDLDLDDDLK